MRGTIFAWKNSPEISIMHDLSATFIDTNNDPIDHPYILGVVDEMNPDMVMTFPEAGVHAIMMTFKDNAKQNACINAWSQTYIC